MRTLTAMTEGILQLFFPNTCRCCDYPLPHRNQLICFRCECDLPLTGFEAQGGNPVEKTFYGRVPLESATSLLFFNSQSLTQRLVHCIKYGNDPDLAVELGRRMGRIWQQQQRLLKADAIIPLPLHRKRERQRGYNQAERLAAGMAAVLNVPCRNDIVIRIRESATQTRKTRTERWQNADGLFAVQTGKELHGQHLLLVDDVITTGATLEACAAVLFNERARVSIATLGFAMK